MDISAAWSGAQADYTVNAPKYCRKALKLGIILFVKSYLFRAFTLDSRKLITRLGDQSLGCCREQFAFQVFLQDVASDAVLQSIQ